MGLIDTHCHLDAEEFAADRSACWLAAQDGGVKAAVIPAVSVANFAAVATLCRTYEGCFAAFGIHPLALSSALGVVPESVGQGSDLDVLRHYLQHEHAVAVGEIGLDHHVVGVDREQQKTVFLAQLKIARELQLPVLLHVRRAVDEVLLCLKKVPVMGGIAHAFNGSLQQAEIFMRMGFKLGFGGACTHPGAHRLHRLLRALPLSALVLETDAPDMSPAWRRGLRNSPAELPRIAQKIAALRDVPLAELLRQTRANALTVLPALAARLSDGPC